MNKKNIDFSKLKGLTVKAAFHVALSVLLEDKTPQDVDDVIKSLRAANVFSNRMNYSKVRDRLLSILKRNERA
ncbi:MAG: hypothetical protein LUD48_02195 [Prevotella sp.]|nr:hypothetical protein [Prevotella sp.]